MIKVAKFRKDRSAWNSKLADLPDLFQQHGTLYTL